MGTEEKLPNVHRAAGEITADQIVVLVLKLGGREDGTRDDAIAKAGSEPFDLSLDWLEAISTAAVRDVAIGPGSMVTHRSAGWIKQRGLDEQNERSVGGEPPLGRDDLLQRSSKMDGGGAGTRLLRNYEKLFSAYDDPISIYRKIIVVDAPPQVSKSVS